MRKFLFAIIAVFIGCCSVNAQNTTVTGPRKRQSRTTVVKKRKTNGTTKAKSSATVSSPTGYINGYGYVDLGLSVKWATCNVGASSSIGCGDYYSWGEIETKSAYEYTERAYTYYQQNIGNDIKGTSYDVAHLKWGDSWRMPTKSEWEELNNQCSWTWTSISGYKGYKVKGPSGKSIFLPAAGFPHENKIDYIGLFGIYYSSTVDNITYAWILNFGPSYHEVSGCFRGNGGSIRPVSN